jgi:hypothetical protein
MAFSPSTGSTNRDAWTSRTNVGTATASRDATSEKAIASSTGVNRRERVRLD